MLYGIYKMKQIIDCSYLDFHCKSQMTRENIIKAPVDVLLDDFIEMYTRLADIKEILDKMIQEGDENNELQRSTGTKI